MTLVHSEDLEQIWDNKQFMVIDIFFRRSVITNSLLNSIKQSNTFSVLESKHKEFFVM